MYTYNAKTMFGPGEWINDYNHDMSGMMSYTGIRQKKHYRQYPCSSSSVFDTQLSVFVSENIRIRI
jgi:hypothetical protein